MAEVDPLRRRYNERIGTALKKYQIDEVIGIGGMAVVFRATHRNGHAVAIKLLHREHSIDTDVRARFLREGYVANKVGHPGVVRVLDDDIAEDGSVFLVMELLDGETLKDRLERSGGPLDVEDVAAIGYQLLEILEAAHEKQIVHRDIKPENLFLQRDGAVRVLDFGIARLRDTPGSPTATRTGKALGTPAFMPPEQALGRKHQIDRRTDVWSVAATMFTALSGEFVHKAETIEEVVVLTATQRARELRTVVSHVPKPIADVIDLALAFDREDRWASARAMQEALSSAFVEVYGTAIPTTFAFSKLPMPSARKVAAALAPTVPSGIATGGDPRGASATSANISTERNAEPDRSSAMRGRRPLAALVGAVLVITATTWFIGVHGQRSTPQAATVAPELTSLGATEPLPTTSVEASRPTAAALAAAIASGPSTDAIQDSGTPPVAASAVHHHASSQGTTHRTQPAARASTPTTPATATNDIFKP